MSTARMTIVAAPIVVPIPVILVAVAAASIRRRRRRIVRTTATATATSRVAATITRLRVPILALTRSGPKSTIVAAIRALIATSAAIATLVRTTTGRLRLVSSAPVAAHAAIVVVTTTATAASLAAAAAAAHTMMRCSRRGRSSCRRMISRILFALGVRKTRLQIDIVLLREVLQFLLDLLLDGHRNARKQRREPVQFHEELVQHLTDGGGRLAAARLRFHFLVVQQVLLVPVVQVGRWLRVPDVHEAERPDVRRIGVCQQAIELFARQAQRVQFVQQTVGGGDDAAGANAADLLKTNTQEQTGFIKLRLMSTNT